MKAARVGICVTLVSGLAGAAMADSMSTRNSGALMGSQLEVLDGRAAAQYSNSVRLRPPPVVVPGQPGTGPAYRGDYRGPYLDLARDAARRHDIPEGLFLRLVQQESGWNRRARSHAGAMGLAQLMPATARNLGVRDVWDPQQNLEAGARYLRAQFDSFRTWPLALAAYNAGPDAVRRHGGIPPYRETRDYVAIIWEE